MTHLDDLGSIQRVQQDQALHHILTSLGLNSSELNSDVSSINPIIIQAETLRVSLWALATSANEAELEPVYVTRLLNLSTKLFPKKLISCLDVGIDGQEIKSDPVYDIFRKTLDDMESIGDVAVIPGGKWLPAPLRCVALPDISRWLLIGGLPTRELPNEIKQTLEFSESVRLLKKHPLECGLNIVSQSKDDWCRIPSQPLSEWTTQILNSTNLQPAPSGDTEYDYYAPGNNRLSRAFSNLQFDRWTTQTQLLSDGRYLVRRKSPFGLVSYAVGRIEMGSLKEISYLHLGQGDVRRLLYGLDLQNNCPVVAKRKRLNSGSWLFSFSNELPGPEKRIFLALGRLNPNLDGKYYPRKWEIPNSYLNEVESRLIDLGIKLVFN